MKNWHNKLTQLYQEQIENKAKVIINNFETCIKNNKYYYDDTFYPSLGQNYEEQFIIYNDILEYLSMQGFYCYYNDKYDQKLLYVISTSALKHYSHWKCYEPIKKYNIPPPEYKD